MEKSKTDKAITQQLFSSNTENVLSAIKKLDDSGNKDYLPLLFQLLSSNTETQISEAICKLLGRVKDKNTIPVFISALENEKYKNARKEIVSACWQNGLDFSDYIEKFIDLIIAEDWEIAFEAFTVVDNLNNTPSDDTLKDINIKISAALDNNDKQKTYLLKEVQNFLSK